MHQTRAQWHTSHGCERSPCARLSRVRAVPCVRTRESGRTLRMFTELGWDPRANAPMPGARPPSLAVNPPFSPDLAPSLAEVLAPRARLLAAANSYLFMWWLAGNHRGAAIGRQGSAAHARGRRARAALLGQHGSQANANANAKAGAGARARARVRIRAATQGSCGCARGDRVAGAEATCTACVGSGGCAGGHRDFARTRERGERWRPRLGADGGQESQGRGGTLVGVRPGAELRGAGAGGYAGFWQEPRLRGAGAR